MCDVCACGVKRVCCVLSPIVMCVRAHACLGVCERERESTSCLRSFTRTVSLAEASRGLCVAMAMRGRLERAVRFAQQDLS